MKPKYTGFTLLEMMLALALASLLMSGLFSVYHVIKNNQDNIEVWSEQIEQYRFLTLFFIQQIHDVNSFCAQQKKETVEIFSANNTPSWISRKKVGSDILILPDCHLTKAIDRDEITAYYIDKAHYQSKSEKTQMALFQKQKGSDREELLAGMESMQAKLCYQKNGLLHCLKHLKKLSLPIEGVKLDFILDSKFNNHFSFYVRVLKHAA